MRRTLVQLEEQMYRRLRQEAYRQERSMAAIVRDLIAKGLDDPRPGTGSPRARRFQSVRAGRSRQADASPVSERHDDALASAIKR
jgi:hypothetical protein